MTAAAGIRPSSLCIGPLATETVARLARTLGDAVLWAGGSATPETLDGRLRARPLGDGGERPGPRDVVLLRTAGGACAADLEDLAEARALVVLDDPDAPPVDAMAGLVATLEAAGWRLAYAGAPPGLRDAGDGSGTMMAIAGRAGDTALAEALDNGPLSLALDHDVLTGAAPADRARVLIASYEVEGPTGNGGIGTAYRSLATSLAGSGHDVTLLFTGWLDPVDHTQRDAWTRDLARAGVTFDALGTPWDSPVRSPHHAVRRAYELHRWLLAQHAANPFDVVHVPETMGHGALAITAKRLGVAFADIEFVVGAHSSTRWVAESSRDGLEDLDQLVVEWLEQRSVEDADVLISPTAYLLDYMRARGWRLPRRAFVQPLARPMSTASALRTPDAAAAPGLPEELVFFGRLETRKGLETFCDAVGLLAADGILRRRGIGVTFLGRPESVMGVDASSYIEARAATWDVPTRVIGDLGHDRAIEVVRGSNGLLVMPSLVDNSPNTVLEAIDLGLPFVAARSGGIPELIAAHDLARATFDGFAGEPGLQPPSFDDDLPATDAIALARAIVGRLTEPHVPVAPAVTREACDRVYDTWHRAAAGRRGSPGRTPARTAPSVGVYLEAQDPDRVARIAGDLRAGDLAPGQIVALCTGAAPGRPVDGVEIRHAVGRSTGPERARAHSRRPGGSELPQSAPTGADAAASR